MPLHRAMKLRYAHEDWCRENCDGRFQFHAPMAFHGYVFRFELASDAVKYKLAADSIEVNLS